ncbi:type I-E CRISPR-associated protein Cas5/CasD [Streptomyces sp. SID1328]|uniref:type I-E CRISPR-associated protein Cas5/CasD n=1 Tax=Streptomyces sp. SID1328 TaxID=2690250 RepID=UPI00136E97FC|nr:type I-E CRISPR-associated protein Cas5/CasD [Streptomyces sp. SID1328]MYV38412.1 type I-E CRISPR-associated protein Cas5/CasD [Streptomyces sp. SID1328]
MPGILMHLSGPLQSFGEHSNFTDRDTHARPTRSALIGMLAAAQGRHRDADLSDLRTLRFTIRTDRSGVRTVDFHTVGGGLPKDRSVPSANGDRKAEGKATVVTQRHYLADAAFTIAVDGNPTLINALTTALHSPRWPLYLGRRACPPAGPLLIATGLADAAAALASFPLHRRRPADANTVTVDVAHDRPPTTGHPARHHLQDDPESFDDYHRSWNVRTEYVTTLTLPADLCAGLGTDWINALATAQGLEATA